MAGVPCPETPANGQAIAPLPAGVMGPVPSPAATLRGSLLTIVEQVCHQVSGEQPVATESVYERRSESEEQVFGPRKVTAGERWGVVERGWVNGEVASWLLSNEE